MIQSGKFYPDTKFIAPIPGHGLDYDRMQTMWRLARYPRSKTAMDIIDVFFHSTRAILQRYFDQRENQPGYRAFAAENDSIVRRQVAEGVRPAGEPRAPSLPPSEHSIDINAGPDFVPMDTDGRHVAREAAREDALLKLNDDEIPVHLHILRNALVRAGVTPQTLATFDAARATREANVAGTGEGTVPKPRAGAREDAAVASGLDVVIDRTPTSGYWKNIAPLLPSRAKARWTDASGVVRTQY